MEIIAHIITISTSMDAKGIASELIKAFEQKHILYLCGNGGSSTLSNHFAAEFICKYRKNRKPLPAVSLTANNAILTAMPNDFPLGFEGLFARQITALGHEGDVLIGLSTSGRSRNVLLAYAEAKLKGMTVIDFPREGKDVGEIQNYQTALMHEVCGIVEDYFYE